MIRLFFHHLKRALASLRILYILVAMALAILLIVIDHPASNLHFGDVMTLGSRNGVMMGGILLFVLSYLTHEEDQCAIIPMTKQRNRYALSRLLALDVIVLLVNVIYTALLAAIVPLAMNVVIAKTSFKVMMIIGLSYAFLEIMGVTLFVLLSSFMKATIYRFDVLIVMSLMPVLLSYGRPYIKQPILTKLLYSQSLGIRLTNLVIALIISVIVTLIYGFLANRRAAC